MRSIVRSIIVCLCCFTTLWAQDNKSAPQVNPFSLSPDNLGAIANSVNLFTGEIGLPLSLISIPNRGAGINVSLYYSSADIVTQASGWNLDYPTSVVGLGWRLPLIQIIVDNKQTAVRDDDDFYFQDGHSSNLLVCVGINGGVRSYRTKDFSNILITYTSTSERWDIVQEDGSKMVFGDMNNFPTSVQWAVSWGNWMGSSNEAGYIPEGVAWNLSSVTNVWGDQTKYTYLKVENPVGNGGSASFVQTEASYLSSIMDNQGHQVDLVYGDKTSEEYMEPYTEQVEPDAYQERYEKKYLDRIVVKGDGTSYYEIDFRYTFATYVFPVFGNSTKRHLASIVKVASSGGLTAPVMSFNYMPPGFMMGALSKVTTPYGGSVSFQYSPTPVAIASSMTVDVFAQSGYAEPMVFQSDDYSVVTFRKLLNGNHDANPQPLAVNVNTWEGYWKSTALPISGAYYSSVSRLGSANGPQDFLLATGPDFFALLLRDNSKTPSQWYRLFIWKKNEASGAWDMFTDQIDFGTSSDPTKKQLFVGNKFVAASNNYGSIFRYVWTGSAWVAGPHISEAAGTHFTVAANNYIISHATNPSPDVINFYYLDEQKNWVGPKSINNSWDNGTGPAYWYATNSHAIVMPSGSNLRSVHWDNTYNTFYQIDNQVNYSAYSPSLYVSENFTGFDPFSTGSSSIARGFRFDGVYWKDTQEKSGDGMSAFGDDYVLGVGNQSYFTFSPNTGLWSGVSANGLGLTSVGGVNSFLLKKQLFSRQPNAQWYAQTLSLPFTDGYAGSYAGQGFFINNNTIFYIEGGRSVTPTFSLSSLPRSQYYVSVNPGDPRPTYMVGNRSIALSTGGTFQDVTSITILRLDLKSHNASVFNDNPVTLVTRWDGTRNYYTSYIYEPAFAITDPSRSVAQYNKVTTIEGVQSTSVTNAPYGYTTTDFLNGNADVAVGTPNNGVPVTTMTALYSYRKLTGRQIRTQSFDANNGFYTRTDFAYEVIGYPASDGVTQYGHPLSSAAGQVDIAFQPLIASTVSDTRTVGLSGTNAKTMEVVSFKTYNSIGQLIQQKDFTNSGGSLLGDNGTATEMVQTDISYAWQFYPSLVTMNILSPQFQVTKTNPALSLPMESQVTRWKENWPCTGPNCLSGSVPGPYDTYSWNRTNTTNFTWSNISSTPSTDWRLQSMISQRDAYNGVETELVAKGQQRKVQIWDNYRRSVVAQVSNASLNQVAYAGFEDASKGNWAWGSDCTVASGTSKTGNFYLNLGTTGLSKSGLSTSDSYKVSFWASTSGGSVSITGVGTVSLGNTNGWALFQYTVSNVSSLTINLVSGGVALDDVRILPAYGQMSTQTFHPLFGPTSIMDANNRSGFILYDQLGRSVNKVDENGNIISNVIYNIQKQ